MKCNAPKADEINKVSGDLNLSLYELTKSMVVSQGPADEEKIEKFKEIVTDFCIKHTNNDEERYFMLLNRDINYYTIFNLTTYLSVSEHIADVLIECVQERGEIYSVSYIEETDGIEIWAKVGEELGCYLFFDYTLGVINVEI